MPTDRPIKHFRLEGERPFKTYNPGRSSMLFPESNPGRSSLQFPESNPSRSSLLFPESNPGRSSLLFPESNPGSSSFLFPETSRRYEQQASLPTNESSIIQYQQLRQRHEPTDYLLLSPSPQQGHQNVLLNNHLTNYDNNAVDLADTGNHQMRSNPIPPSEGNHQMRSNLISPCEGNHQMRSNLIPPSEGNRMRSNPMPPSESLMYQGDPDLNISNIGSSHTALPNFIIPNRSVLRTPAACSFVEHELNSMLYDHHMALISNGPSRSTDNSFRPNTSSLVTGQHSQGISTTFPNVVTSNTVLSRPGATMVFPVNKDDFLVRHEVNELGFTMILSPERYLFYKEQKEIFLKEQKERNFRDFQKFNLHISPSLSSMSSVAERRTSSETNCPMSSVAERRMSSVAERRTSSVAERRMSSEATSSQDKASMATTCLSDSSDEKNVGEHTKQLTYVEKRRKNNDSAKRSREARRTKEQLIAIKIVQLQEEKIRLLAEMHLYEKEIQDLRYRIFQCN